MFPTSDVVGFVLLSIMLYIASGLEEALHVFSPATLYRRSP